MKKVYTLFAALCLMGYAVNAQVLQQDSTISGSICVYTDTGEYKIVIPVDGMLEIFTTAAVPDSTVPGQGNLAVSVKDTRYQTFSTFYPRTGVNGVPLSDTGYQCCLAADTFYIWTYRGWAFSLCWDYTIRWRIIPPTYAAGPQPDSFPTYAQPMPYNTPVTGHIGFEQYLGVGTTNNNWLIVPPGDGVLKVNLSSEIEAGSNLNLSIADNNRSVFSTQYLYAGTFLSPFDTTFYWDCISGDDSFYLEPNISVFGEAGVDYQMSYTIIPPVYNNDAEPNNNFAQAQVFSPDTPVHGHIYFDGETDDDYFQFRKPDTGFLNVAISVETAGPTAAYTLVVVLLDSSQNPIKTVYPTIGLNSVPVTDSLFMASLGEGLYYLHVYSPYNGRPCMSYKMDVTSPTIATNTGFGRVGAALPLTVFPNPTANNFTVDFGDTKNTTINVYNLMGELVETTLQKNERYVSMGQKLASGLYLVKAVDSNGEVVSQGKVIKTQ